MDTRHKRLRGRYTAWVFGMVIVCLAVLVFLMVVFRSPPSGRISVVIASDPVILWSWDTYDGHAVIVTIPADTVVTSVHGYGQYALSSLWKFGGMDSRERGLFSQTISDIMAVPVPWYVGFSRSDVVKFSDPFDALGRIFAPSATLSYLGGAEKTNMSLIQFLTFVRAFVGTSKGKTTVVNLSPDNAMTQVQLPDGSRVQGIDLARLDSVLVDDFEDTRVREEALHVAVYNATHIPTLGNRFARFLSHMGISVVIVGNSDQYISSVCELRAGPANLRSMTAQSIRNAFGCTLVSVHQDEGRADLTVLVGNGYASNY